MSDLHNITPEDSPVVEFMVVADYVVGTPDGKLTMVGAFDTINALKLPIALPTMGIGARIRDRAQKKGNPPHTFEVRLKAPDGSAMMQMQGGFPGELPNGSVERGGSVPLTLMMGNISFPKYGTYQAEIWIDKRRAFSVPLYVVKPPVANIQ
jgi:hypothetical protein